MNVRVAGGTASPMEKKRSERERRQRMKALCEKLASLIPKEHFSNPVRPQNSTPYVVQFVTLSAE